MKQVLYKILICSIFILICTISTNAQKIKKTQVLVLGTIHLEQTKGVQKSFIDRLLDSLTLYNFNVIAIEQMPSELLLDIERRPGPQWKDLLSNYGNTIKIGKQFQKLYNINYDNAQLIIDSLLTKNELTESDRIKFIKASLCAYDPWTASLQYQLISNKKIVDTTAVLLLNKYNKSLNEINLVGVNLAKKMSLNKLYPIDNFQDETILLHDFPEFLNDYQASQDKIKLLLKNPFYDKLDSIKSGDINKGDLFDTYKFLNSGEYMSEDKKGQWDIWLKTNFKSKTDRSRYSLWEMRNLQIAANIMRLVASYPEKKILVIIGSSHKSFIENSLKQMSDVEVLKF